MEYPTKLRFTSHYRRYQVFLVSPRKHLVDGELVHIPGKMLQFEDWQCNCSDPETIKLALESGYYGKDFFSPDWEQMKKEDNKNEEEQNEDTVPVQKKRGRKPKTTE